MKVKGFLKDVGGASRVTAMRKELLEKGSPVPDPKDPIRDLADRLHPGAQEFTVTEIRDVSPTSKTFRLKPVNGHVPVFQCGQFASFELNIGNSVLTRAYSISSAPFEARGEEPFFEITIRRNRTYFVPDWFFENVRVGSSLTASLPYGHFYYEPLRDSRNIIAIAGGSGITPFVSMAKEIVHGTMDVNLTVLYGSVSHTDIVCKDELDSCEKACPEKIRIIHVMSDDESWEGEKGFITKQLIEKYAAAIEDPSYFFCGPAVMFFQIEKIMKEMNVPLRRFRHDTIPQPDVKLIPGFPEEQIGKTYKMTVVRGIHEDVIDAAADEPIAVSLERAGIKVDTKCRGGECGHCRAQLLSGNIFVSPLGDYRRAMDKELGWFHSCSAYPAEDLKIKIPIL
ncbi:MAG: 2Fe-2S iron-sulfur cluster binding domain-containing protein [Solobacterium sp.]|nr:2Fe-2S iron-sulfur cluster binding domain-containing protein [Solobacterium sp.]